MLDDLVLPEFFSLRVATPDDEAFMVALFASVSQHLQMINLPDEALELLMHQQYRTRQYFWQTNWPNAITFIVMRLGQPIGKMIFHREAGLLHLIDIIFAVDARGKGYGTTILNAILNLADQQGDQFQLSVSKDNPRAKSLYLSLGFQVIDVSEFYERLIRNSKYSRQGTGIR